MTRRNAANRSVHRSRRREVPQNIEELDAGKTVSYLEARYPDHRP
jgi:hypothetical protein